MLSKFEWSEIIIVGLVGGVTAACIGLAIRFGATVDNLLNFFGAAVGTGLAVVSTLWLESRRRARALEKMLTSLVIAASVAMRFKSIKDSQIPPLIVTFQQSAQAFEASRLGANVEDPLHQYAFQSAVFWLQQALKEMEGYLQDFATGKLSEKLLAEKSRKSALKMIGATEDFLKLPGLSKLPLAAFLHHQSKVDVPM